MSSTTDRNLINTSIDIVTILKEAKKRWLLYTVFFIGCIGIAYVYNKTAVKKYKIGSTILMNIREENNDSRDYLTANGLSYFGHGTTLSNELQALGSTPLIRKALQNMDWKVSYYEKQLLGFKNIYGFTPFKIVINEKKDQVIGSKIKLRFIDANTCHIHVEHTDLKKYNYNTFKETGKVSSIAFDKVVQVGEIIEDKDYSFIILFDEDKFESDFKEKVYAFEFNSLSTLSADIKSELMISPFDTESSVINIELIHSSTKFAMDFIQNLTSEYMHLNLEKKNHAALQTINYIDRQIGNIKDSLNITESKLQNFRVTHQIVDIETKSRTAQDQIQSLLNEKATLEDRIEYYNYLADYFKDESEETTEFIAPSTMSIEDPLLTSLIQSLLECNSERNTLRRNNQQRSPRYQTLTIRAESIHNSIDENIKNVRSSSQLTLNSLNERIDKLRIEIQKLPGTSRRLSGLERKYNVDNEIYTYLLQRRAESEIARASSLPDNETIEPAAILGVAEPNSKFIYVVAFLLALIIPSLPVLGNTVLNSKIINKSDLKKIKKVFFAGAVYHNSEKNESQVFKNLPNSEIAESFRSVRANLDFLNPDSHRQIFLVTSSFTGEGKSFIATNLAYSIAASNKKVALVDFDLRRPTIHEKVKHKTHVPGVSNFLAGQIEFKDLIVNSGFNKLDYIFSGELPPNPNELITSERTTKFYNYLRDNYDYIVIDTPPVGIVTDANYLLKLSDIAVFVVRQNFTSIQGFEQAMSDIIKLFPGKITTILNDYKYTWANADYHANNSYKNYYGGHHKPEKKFLWFKS